MDMVTLNTKTKTLGRKDTIRIANIALRWCKNVLGENNRKKYLIKWYIHKDPYGDLGSYDAEDHEIYIYWNNHETVQELIETCIHEWTHSKQPVRTKYWKFPHSYSRNPYERQAKYAEKKWLPQCWNDIKNKINKTKWITQ